MSVGETLRKAREAKGLSIEDVKNSTQIMARQLQEMEDDDFSSFADPFYAKFFVRSFARAVGLDPGPVVEAFVEQTAGGRGAAPKPAPKPVAAAAPAPAPKPEPKPEPAPAAAPEAPAAAPTPEAEAADDLFSLAVAPKPAAPEVSEEPKPAAAPARTTAKVVAAIPLAFERRAAQRPQPEKRVAAVEPGAPAPAPAPERGARREGRAEFVPPPAAKKLPEPQSAAFRGTPSDGHPVAPEPIPLAGAPFRFPEDAGDLPFPETEADAPTEAAPAIPSPAPALQSRQRKNLAPEKDEEIVAAAPAAPTTAPAAPAKDEPLFAEKATKRKREPRPDAPNAAALFLSNLVASARKALSRKPRRGPLLAGAAALVALCVAGGVYIAAGGRGDGGSDAPGETPAPPPDAFVAPADPDPATAPEPPEPIAPVFPPPASWAK